MLIFNSFEEFDEAVYDWELDFKQLSKGPLQATLEVCISGEILLYQCSFDTTIDQIGVAPLGMRTYCILAPNSSPANWCKHQLDGHFILEFPPNKEFHGISQPGFNVITLSISDSKLHSIARKAGYEKAPLAKAFTAHTSTYEEQLNLYTLAKKLIQTGDSWLKESIEDALISTILKISSRDQYLITQASRRREAVDHATQYIRKHLEHPIDSNDIVNSTEVSKRTLEYSFQQYFGLSPKKYAKYLKLNRIHQLLLNNTNQKSIADIADIYGFSHMSQFANDFKALFGELPSNIGRK